MGSHEQYRRSSYARRPYHGYPDVDDDEQCLDLHAGSNGFALEDNLADLPLQSYNLQPAYQPALSSMDPTILGQYQPQMWPQPGRSPQQGQSWNERYPNSVTVQDVSNYQMNPFGAPGDWQIDQGYPLEQGGAFPYPLGPRQFDTTPFNANLQQEPWSIYHPLDVNHEPGILEGAPGPGLEEVPDTTHSTTDHVSENMEDSVVTERPVPDYPRYANADQIPPYYLPQYPLPIHIDIERSATPLETPSTTQGSSQWEFGLDVPMQRSHSTRSSVSNASSAGPPPTHTPEIMYCEVVDCRQAFTGLYSRGNLGRHRRLVHGTGSRYVCGDDTCAKEFRRQDARLKHYRKYHPDLAADSPLVRRSSASRPTRRNQEDDLSNMSSWAT